MHLLISILIPLLAALWVFIDAKEKGRSRGQAILWAFGTFMALIIFLPLWLFVRWREVQPKNTQLCSFCRSSFKEIPRARYCPYCGQRLETSEHSQTIDIEYQKEEKDKSQSNGESPQR